MSDTNVEKLDTRGEQRTVEPVDDESGLTKTADGPGLMKADDEAELTRSEGKANLKPDDEAELKPDDEAEMRSEDRAQLESTFNAKTEEAATSNAKPAHTVNASAENSMDAKTESTRDAESERKEQDESKDELKDAPTVEIEPTDQAKEQTETTEEEPLLGPQAPALPPRTRTQTPAQSSGPDRGLDARTHYRLKDMQWHDPLTNRTRDVKI
ncbi:hypothetical protein IW139_006052, partial [Coemansia sp. RSA 353]